MVTGPDIDLPPAQDPDAFEELPRHDLGGVMRQKLPPPRVYGNLLYHGRLHTLTGPPEAGKTITALWLARAAMTAGRGVLMIDEETGPRQVADLFNSMGTDPDLIDKHLHYMAFSGRAWRGENLDHLHALAARRRPSLAIFDSAAELLAAAGCDENSPGDVTRFWSSVLRPIARLGCSVLLLDHDGKATTGTRYGRGTGAKLAAPDVSLKLEPLRPFSRTDNGALKLTIAKDRLGCLHRWWKIAVTAAPLALRFDKTIFAHADADNLAPATRGLLSALDDVPSDQRVLMDRFVEANGHGLYRETVSKALTELLELGLADRIDQGKGKPALWLRAVASPPPGDSTDPGTGKQDAEPRGIPDQPLTGWPEGSAGEAANP